MLQKLKKRNLWGYMIIFISFVYFIFRLSSLTKIPIFNDESSYLDWGWRMLHDPTIPFYSITNGDGKQPLLMWVFGLFEIFINDPLWAGRIVSVITGFAALLGIYVLAKRL
jgi:4-amino-4-deoxy-L-arabinose transferase-like glycosyltransferase